MVKQPTEPRLDPASTNGWGEYRRMVLRELERSSEILEDIQSSLNDLKTRITLVEADIETRVARIEAAQRRRNQIWWAILGTVGLLVGTRFFDWLVEIGAIFK